MVEELKITQADRNAAVRLLEEGGQDWQAKEIRIGDGDHFPIVQAFARHRIASTPDGTGSGEAMREAVARVISLAKGQPETGQTSVGAWWWDARHDRARPEHFEGECRDEDRAHADLMLPMLQAIFATHKRDEEQAGEVYRHVKRGTEYQIVAIGELQMNLDLLVDGSSMVIYRGEDGKHWVRLEEEFFDGRFERVPSALAAAHKEQS